MYLRAVHAEQDIPTLRAFIRENPLGILTTTIEPSSPSDHFIQSSHIPFILDVSDDESPTELGKLRGHMARANPQTKAMIAELTSRASADSSSSSKTCTLSKEVLVLFNGPVHHYVTPKFYKQTKPTTGKVVPTWDYAAVQVYGRVTIYHDTQDDETDAFISRAISDLTSFSETTQTGRGVEHGEPWGVEDSPETYVALLKKAIIGIEIEITDIGGKWKMSQEMKGGDHEGVIEGFEAMGSEAGKAMAETVRQRGKLADEKKA
ncbi:hypothetical protein D9758_012996 [Tetrapyrgos nigripes]|uniref:Transcriptional regulator n=1 Tax=Tetrapyrgos nigripes TaxID=182062 RepID=A0A8H5CBF6_9AGAR|nr:hypothetical protein D9758_012996 [Tetrapyrgos nigripes]